MFERLFVITALTTGLAGPAAIAEQYVVQINGPFAGSSDGLRSTLRIDEIDAFTYEGKDYVVVGAPTEGYLAAYFLAASHAPRTLATLGADWEGAGLENLTLNQRMLFLTPVDCEFCAP